jgi:hypothetical protein
MAGTPLGALVQLELELQQQEQHHLASGGSSGCAGFRSQAGLRLLGWGLKPPPLASAVKAVAVPLQMKAVVGMRRVVAA